MTPVSPVPKLVAAGEAQDDPADERYDNVVGVERNYERLFYGDHKPDRRKKEPMSTSNFNDANRSLSAGKLTNVDPFPSVFPSPPSSVSDEPIGQLSPSKPGNGQTEVERILTPPGERQLKDRNLSLTVGALTHPGIKRQHKLNEDSFFAVQGIRAHPSPAQPFGLFVVADGIGGHARGQDASRQAIQTLADQCMPRLLGSSALKDADFRQLLIDGLQAANQAVHQQNMEQHTAMGTTMTAALVVGATAYMVNVGDSRIYLYREPEGLRKITKDHSVVASLVETGIIQPGDIYTHPRRNQIYRSLGHEPAIEVDAFIEQLQPDDALLLCSDGLWEMVRDPHIEQILRNVPDTSQMGRALIEAALVGGGEDNVSVIVVQVTEALGVRV